MKVRRVALLVLLLVGSACNSQPPLSSMDQFVLDQDWSCRLNGRPTEDAERLGIPITDCDYFIAEAKKIRAR